MYRKWLGKRRQGNSNSSTFCHVRVNTVIVTNDEEFAWKSGALVHTNKYMYNVILNFSQGFGLIHKTESLTFLVKCYRGD